MAVSLPSWLIRWDRRPQSGRGMVLAVFTYDDGVFEEMLFDAGSADNLTVRLNQEALLRQARRVLFLQDQETAVNIADVITKGSLATQRLVYSTAAQNLVALKDAFDNGGKADRVMIGDYFLTLTNTQLQNVVGLTVGQITFLRNNAASIQEAATTIRTGLQ